MCSLVNIPARILHRLSPFGLEISRKNDRTPTHHFAGYRASLFIHQALDARNNETSHATDPGFNSRTGLIVRLMEADLSILDAALTRALLLWYRVAAANEELL